jgi:hypothetical protein
VRRVDISMKLLEKPSGCILWLEFDPDSLAIEQFYWFGNKARTELPDLGRRISRHTRANSKGERSERPGHRVVAKSEFQPLANISEVVEKLFGQD